MDGTTQEYLCEVGGEKMGRIFEKSGRFPVNRVEEIRGERTRCASFHTQIEGSICAPG